MKRFSALLLAFLLAATSAEATYKGGYKGRGNTADTVGTDTTNFNNNLSAADTDVQKALDTLDNASASGAPTTADYLVGTANGSLSNEIAVGTSPGGELGGTWGSPTIDDGITVDAWTLTTPTIAKISNLTTNGVVQTSSSDGTLGVATFTQYAPVYAVTTGTIGTGTAGITGQALRSNGAAAPSYQKDVVRPYIQVYDANTAVAVANCANGNFFSSDETFAVTTVFASVNTASSSGTPTMNVRNVTTGNNILSTAATIDANELNTLTAATPPVVGSNNTVTAGDKLCVDVTVAGTGTKGLVVKMKGQ